MKQRISFLLAMLLCFSLLFSIISPAAMAADKAYDDVRMSFKDLPKVDTWQYESIAYCYANGIMNGMSTTEFSPNGNLTRGQLVTVLYRVAGQPEIAYEKVFPDVAANEYYTLPIIWAAKNGIVNGFEDGTFRPKTPVTREQLATILYRYSGSPDVSGDLSAYPDASAVQSYSKIPMLWATQNGFLPGETEEIAVRLAPRTNAARVQIAAFIMRFLKKDNSESEKISLTFTEDTWPIVDGATAFLPFYQEMAARMLSISTDKAADYIMCSTTDYAYPYLWEKKVDLVYCLRPSEEQVKRAAQNGVVFEEVPFANEGFVFFVNRENPVDSITVQQLHDIYAGKITNWKELGGNDEEIIAYQRTEGSGSQTGLYLHVIDPSEVVEPPMEKRIGSMAAIIDEVANYKNAAGAIGYSYRYFVTNMHYDEQIKMLKVNGVYPDYDAIADGSYPLISDICAVYREDEPADSSVRKIARWCASSQGAVLAKELGYVPTAEAIGTLYKENHPSDDVVIDYAKGNPCPECTVMSTYYSNNLRIQNIREGNGSYIQISGLKNKEIQDAINKKIYDTFMELSEVAYPPYPGVRTRLAAFEAGGNYGETHISTTVEGSFNHMLSIVISKTQRYRKDLDRIDLENIRTLNLDLNTGKEIYIGDLFADNMEGIAYINDKIFEESTKPEAFDEPPVQHFVNETDSGIAIYFRRAFEGINFNQKYYIDQNTGDMHIILDYENPEIANLFTYTDYAIDMRGISAYESRFMTPESIFTNEESSPTLFRRSFIVNDDTAEREFTEQWSEGRTISLDSSLKFYDEKDKNYIKTAIISDERLAELKTEIESLYDAREQAGGYELYGDMEIIVDAMRYGNYTNISSEISYYIYGCNSDGDWGTWDQYYELTNHCIKADSGEPVTLQELFKTDVDYNTSISEILTSRLKDDLEGTYSDETCRAIASELLDHIDGFAVEKDSLYLYCADYANILRRYVPDKSSVLWHSDRILRLNYKDLGAENLTIFD